MRCSQQTLWLSGAYASLLARRIRPACGLELPAVPGPQGVYPLRGTYRLKSYLPAQSCLQIEAPAEPPGRAPELCPGSGTVSPPLSAARKTRATRPGSDSPAAEVR